MTVPEGCVECIELIKQQLVILKEKDRQISSLHTTQKGFEKQLQKSSLLMARAREAQMVQIAETARWKQHVMDLRSQLSSQALEIAAIVRDQQTLDAKHDVILSHFMDPAQNLMHMFNAVTNEYEAAELSEIV
jgi:hypothetical protein